MPTPTVSPNYADAASVDALHYTELAQQHLDHVGGDLITLPDDQVLRAAAVYALLAQCAATDRLTDALSQRLDDVAVNVQDLVDRLDAVVRVVDPGPGPVRRWLAARRPFRMILT
jgi:hypothetical protein